VQLRTASGWGSEAWEAGIAAACLDGVGKLGTVAASFDLDVALILTPIAAARPEPDAAHDAATVDYARRQYQRLRAGLFATPRPGGDPRLTVHDGEAAFAAAPGPVFRDAIHLNADGRRRMAAHLAILAQTRLAAR